MQYQKGKGGATLKRFPSHANRIIKTKKKMDNSLAVHNEKKYQKTYLANGKKVSLNLETVCKYLVRGDGRVTEEEVLWFIGLCSLQNLNPFLNEIYLIKMGNYPATPIVAKEAYMKRAEASPAFDGMESGLIVLRDGNVVETKGAFYLSKDEIVGAWASVYRKDRARPFTIAVSFDEYKKTRWDNTKKCHVLTSFWKEKPGTMIRKVAVVQALREAFPNTLGALYTAEEVKACEYSEEELQQESAKKGVPPEMDFEAENSETLELPEETDAGESLSDLNLDIEPGTESKEVAKRSQPKPDTKKEQAIDWGAPGF